MCAQSQYQCCNLLSVSTVLQTNNHRQFLRPQLCQLTLSNIWRSGSLNNDYCFCERTISCLIYIWPQLHHKLEKHFETKNMYRGLLLRIKLSNLRMYDVKSINDYAKRYTSSIFSIGASINLRQLVNITLQSLNVDYQQVVISIFFCRRDTINLGEYLWISTSKKKSREIIFCFRSHQVMHFLLKTVRNFKKRRISLIVHVMMLISQFKLMEAKARSMVHKTIVARNAIRTNFTTNKSLILRRASSRLRRSTTLLKRRSVMV